MNKSSNMYTEHLISYARQIAICRAYENLVGGLQPYLVLKKKYEHEIEELDEAQASKEYLDVLSEAADVLYYGAQLKAQDPPGYWWLSAYSEVGRRSIRIQDAYNAALAKYQFRAQRAQQGLFEKDFDVEREIIRQAINNELEYNDDDE